MKWENGGYENIEDRLRLIWECSNCQAQFYGDNGINPPIHDCPVCGRKNEEKLENE